MKIVIDRFEGDYAIAELEDGSYANMPKVFVPNAHEGDVVNISIDTEETQKRQESTKSLLHSLFKK